MSKTATDIAEILTELTEFITRFQKTQPDQDLSRLTYNGRVSDKPYPAAFLQSLNKHLADHYSYLQAITEIVSSSTGCSYYRLKFYGPAVFEPRSPTTDRAIAPWSAVRP